MKKILFTTIFAFFFGTTMAQGEETNESPAPLLTSHHIGLSAGGTTGIGFSYRYWPNRWGFQVTTIPIFAQGDFWINGGASALFLMKDNDRVDLFSYFGTRINSNIFEEAIYDPITFEYLGNEKQVDNSFALGLGIGLKIDFWDVLNLNLQTGYGVRNLTNKPGTFLTGEIGIYYQL